MHPILTTESEEPVAAPTAHTPAAPDPYAPVTRYFDHGDEGGVVVREQLVGPVVDVCKELHHAGLHGTKDRKHVASVPVIVIEHFCKVRGITLSTFMRDQHLKRQFLDSPEFADFRIWPGRMLIRHNSKPAAEPAQAETITTAEAA